VCRTLKKVENHWSNETFFCYKIFLVYKNVLLLRHSGEFPRRQFKVRKICLFIDDWSKARLILFETGFRYQGTLTPLSRIATCIFRVRLLQAVMFLKLLLWFKPSNVITWKTQTHAVNARWKRVSQHSFINSRFSIKFCPIFIYFKLFKCLRSVQLSLAGCVFETAAFGRCELFEAEINNYLIRFYGSNYISPDFCFLVFGSAISLGQLLNKC